MFHKDNKSELFTPGFICVLHTFGRDLKWNPHIHCLVSEGGVGNSLRWRPRKHFNYRLLRDSFQTALLNELYSRIGPSFKKVKAAIYAHHRVSDKRLRRAVPRQKPPILLSFNRWRESILHSFGYDPLKCSCCGNTLLLVELYYRHSPVSLHDLYEKVMRRHRRRSPADVSSLSKPLLS